MAELKRNSNRRGMIFKIDFLEERKSSYPSLQFKFLTLMADRILAERCLYLTLFLGRIRHYRNANKRSRAAERRVRARIRPSALIPIQETPNLRRRALQIDGLPTSIHYLVIRSPRLCTPACQRNCTQAA